MDKLVVVIMGQNCEKFIPMCLESVKDADAIVYCDGGSTDETTEYLIHQLHTKDPVTIIMNSYDQENPKMNGIQRNFYLEHLKKNYPDYWCLCLDVDEVCEDINKVKEFIQTAEPALYSVKMEHFIGDLGHVDATRNIHYVPNRLFKISEAVDYPLDSHTVLTGKNQQMTDCTTIWHLGHLPVEYIKYIVKRGNEHLDNSTIHTKRFLQDWKNAHLFGGYPTRPINPTSIPRVILDNFKIDFDELYFINRQDMEAKHYQDAIEWNKYFKVDSMTLLGCGPGQRVKILNDIGVDAVGIELSKYAVDNAYSDMVEQGNVLDYEMTSDVTIAYDILEHLEYDQLDQAIENIIKNTNTHILISVPFKGTPNCDADSTHIIKENRDWWVKQFVSKGLKEVEVPDYFQYREQLLIFIK